MTVDLVSNLDTALRLAKAGFAVFPCHSGGAKAKQPMPFIKWRDASTTAEPQILQWWKKWPDAAVGLDLAKSGLIVIDADRHGEHDGVSALGDLMASIGYEPHGVPLAATPNEGTHFFYRQPSGKQFGNGKGALPAGVDVRGHGGYVIAPGTVMQDGRLYEVFGDIAEAPELPAWLVEKIEARPETRDGMPANLATAPLPTRQDGASDFFSNVNTRALECLSLWVPSIFGRAARHQSSTGAYRVSSKDLSRDLQEDLSLAPDGIVDFGVHDMGDARQGKRTAIDICIQYGDQPDAKAAAFWLCGKLGVTPENMGWLPIADPIEAAAAARRLIENHDGTLADAETGEILDATTSKTEVVDPLYPPGLVGDMARWIVATARRPQPELSIGAALAVVGTLAGRQFAGPTKSGTHLYILGLAPTGTGKDHPLQQISRLMAAAKLSIHLGPSEFISMPAVVNFLMRKPLSVCPMDEFGSFMKRINSRRASGFEGAISKIIRTMWSSSFAPYATPEWAQKESQTIYSPAISLYGASTPEQFYSSMEGASLEDGTLNRFLLMNGQQRPKERDPDYDGAMVPVEIVNDMHLIYYRSGELASSFRNDSNSDPAMAGQLRDVTWCPDGAHERYKAFSAEVEEIMRRDTERGAFYARTAEMALRIATIVAIGRLDDDQVRLSDLEYGIGLAMRSSQMMAEGAADYMADNENQANAQKVLRIIKARGGRVKHRDLLRAMQNAMKGRDLRELIAAMCEAEHIERQEVKAATGPSTFWYQSLD